MELQLTGIPVFSVVMQRIADPNLNGELAANRLNTYSVPSVVRVEAENKYYSKEAHQKLLGEASPGSGLVSGVQRNLPLSLWRRKESH
ncbi:hypothetical protein [Novipirellula artificiosorum]|nr:hypothetical protein [Novipirellula artificiosorum]